jgi:hypoxanthine phosphoribosyltransferase
MTDIYTKPEDYVSPSEIPVLLTETTIAATVTGMSERFKAELEPEFTVVGLLRGSFVFIADLVRALHRADVHPQVDFLTLSSYGDKKESSGRVATVSDLAEDVEGKPVVIVDDILESGRTLKQAKNMMLERGASSVHIAVLLDKRVKREVDIEADFVGFTIPDRFVVGYGLDYAGYYRELPYIGTLD